MAWISIWICIITLQANQKRERPPFARESQRVPSGSVSQLLPMGREDSAPSLCGEQSRGKASVNKASKGWEEGNFPLPALSLQAQAGNLSSKRRLCEHKKKKKTPAFEKLFENLGYITKRKWCGLISCERQ